MKFWKMHGAENDFVLFDVREGSDVAWGLAAPMICDRRRGVGADGILLIEGEVGRVSMCVVNADASIAAMCGNGLRCFAVLCLDLGLIGPIATIGTDAGPRRVEVFPNGHVAVDMGVPSFDARALIVTRDETWVDRPINGLAVTAVSMGNPHLVHFCETDPVYERAAWESTAQALQGASELQEPVNVNLAQVLDRDRVRLITYERGVGFTQACGTGACATVAAGIATHQLNTKVSVQVPGGELTIEQLPDGQMRMTGPTAYAFTGEWNFAEIS